MTKPDLFVSTGEDIEVDPETEMVIERGLRDIDEGKVFSHDQIRALLAEWKSKYGPPSTR